MATVEERVQTLVEDGEYVQDVLDVVNTKIAELRDVVDDYPHGKVDTLRLEIKTRVARDSIDQVGHQGAKMVKNVNNKRKWESGYGENSSQQQNKQQKVMKAYTAGPTSRKSYAGKSPSYNKCKSHHTGPCPVKCRRCQKIGHQSKDCRSKTPATGSNPKSVVTCFGCCEQWHYKNGCPRLKNQNCCNQKDKKRKACGDTNIILDNANA
nr:reverse transcriptase domain-containing protein [Tanacetum cinerariifolium]